MYDITLRDDAIKNNKKYYKSSQFSDITLIPSDNPICIPCHKVILCNSSEYFEKLLTGDFIEQSKDKIILHDFSYYWLDKFIYFIYTSEISFNRNEIEDVLKYGTYLQLYNFNLDDKLYDDIIDLIKVNGHAKILELSKIYSINKWYTYTYNDIIKKHDENILLTLPFNTFDEILPLINIPMDYSKEIEKKCNNRELNITIMNGKYFGNIPDMYHIHDTASISSVIINKLNSEIRRHIYIQDLNIGMIIRDDITTIGINNSDYDNIIREGYQDNTPRLTCSVHYFKIFI